MKKILIVLFTAMLCIGAQAQLRTSRTFFKQDHRSTEWIIRAGLSINNIAGIDTDNEWETSLGSKAGFAVDFGFNKYFGESNLYWGMELGVGTRGFSESYKDEYYDEKSSVTFYNVKYSPFTIGYKFALTDAIKIDPHLGGYISYDFANSNGYYDNLNTSFDAGLQFGVGLWYGRVNLDFMYQRGFVNWYADPSMGKTSNFLIRVGYAF